MKEIIIDRSKWRCGGLSDNLENRLGEGSTLLLNSKGFMCCLGQAALQLGDLTKDDILDSESPSFVSKPIPLLKEIGEIGASTPLARVAMNINDDRSTSVAQKESQLTELFKGADLDLKFVDSI